MLFNPLAADGWVALVQFEALLFAAAFFTIGLLDELAVDLIYVWLKLTKRARTVLVDEQALLRQPLSGPVAVLIPAWQEAAVIGVTLDHALEAWPYPDLAIYVGCYPNDPSTLNAVKASGNDARVHLVVTDRDGPTSKADCLNRLYAALCADEGRSGRAARMVVLHDAEDMVDPASLALLDRALGSADFVQLPVVAVPQPRCWGIGSHYSDEFSESHTRTMVVRSALGGGIPGAGVGCAIARPMLARLAAESAEGNPFATASLTEDYELGLRVAALGGRGRFVRARASGRRLVATRAYFPSTLESAVRQKTRWMHGIALQSWDRMGWSGSIVSRWMQLRDRRGPFAALLLLLGYALAIAFGVTWVGQQLGLVENVPLPAFLRILLLINLAGLLWRALARFVFTAREFGLIEGLFSLPRMLTANTIAILAGYRAAGAYIRSLRGQPVVWDKTEHRKHPVCHLARA